MKSNWKSNRSNWLLFKSNRLQVQLLSKKLKCNRLQVQLLLKVIVITSTTITITFGPNSATDGICYDDTSSLYEYTSAYQHIYIYLNCCIFVSLIKCSYTDILQISVRTGSTVPI